MFSRTTTLLLVATTMLLAPITSQAQDEDGWIALFNGKNLDGWKIGDAKQGKWKIENGNDRGQRPHDPICTRSRNSRTSSSKPR